MIIETLSTFPTMFDSVLNQSMMKRAQDKGILRYCGYDLRDWTYDRHRTTDDDPYGGGQGLIMKCPPIFEAYDCLVGAADYAARPASACEEGPTGPAPQFADAPKPYTIFLSPTGQPFDDACANQLAAHERLLFVCGHYEGIDERAYSLADCVISLGDYVLTSGELAAMVIIDAVVRKLPGVLGAENGADDESFADGLLEYPQYTRPAKYRGMEVPAELLSGNHALIAQWRRHQSLQRTAALRPDLLESAHLTEADRAFLG
ncbi:MAG: tRNA (guanosine(37)-N1)-methyltransferase TrmD [Coriobacteriia bacterium]|nr:tRNA (guanosine(37)-N1)-methyltransferase TrmD [Coriobacteriia bacterium]